jgi:hypothetical protein
MSHGQRVSYVNQTFFFFFYQDTSIKKKSTAGDSAQTEEEDRWKEADGETDEGSESSIPGGY